MSGKCVGVTSEAVKLRVLGVRRGKHRGERLGSAVELTPGAGRATVNDYSNGVLHWQLVSGN